MLLGGFSSSSNASITNTVYKYTIASNSWSTQSGVMPIPTAGGMTEVVNDRMYCIGGETKTGEVATSTQYANATIKSNIGATNTGYSQYIFDVGGFINAGYSNVNTRYDTVANVWASATALPIETAAGSCIVVGNSMYYMGGQTNANVAANAVYAYDLTGTCLSVSTKLAGIGGIKENLGDQKNGWKDYVYVISGRSNPTYKDDNSQYDTVNNTWAAKAVIPDVGDGIIQGASVVSGDNLYYWGGRKLSCRNHNSKSTYL